MMHKKTNHFELSNPFNLSLQLIMNMMISKTMIHVWFFSLICFNLCSAQLDYDHSNCTSKETFPGSRFTCNSTHDDSCKTYLVYRANVLFKTISDISKLFNMSSNEVLHINNLTSSSQVLKQGKEVLLPIHCTCSGEFYQASLSYKVPESTTLSEISCGVFEGLLKYLTLAQENLSQGESPEVGSVLHVPLRCACPGNFSKKVKYLVTYPIMQEDDLEKLTHKFGISPQDFLETNHLNPFSALFAQTVVLIPIDDAPIRIFDIPDSPPPPPGFLPTNPVVKPHESTESSHLYIAGSVLGFVFLSTMLASGLYMKRMRKSDSVHSDHSFNTTNTLWSSPMRSSPTWCLSPDLLLGIKYCLVNYHIKEIEKATKNFSEENKIGDFVYKGLINNLEVMIKRMRFGDTGQVIDLHSKINHINIVNLLGVCYGEGSDSWSYLVFELPKNGSLRDCISDPFINPLTWYRRTQIAFDIATCLYYLHYCSFPSIAHMNVSTINIFITTNWRGKLADLGGVSEIPKGKNSEKVDIFAFGVVLLELISGRENFDGKSVKDCLGFLLGEASGGGCFEGLRSFMDPNLKDYSLPEALCLSFLAKDCVADDPMHRPTMDDIMKVLVKMV